MHDNISYIILVHSKIDISYKFWKYMLHHAPCSWSCQGVAPLLVLEALVVLARLILVVSTRTGTSGSAGTSRTSSSTILWPKRMC